MHEANHNAQEVCVPANLLLYQFQALSKKCYLQRKRNLRVTACEFLSPLMMLSLLMYVLIQSSITHVPQQKFCEINLVVTETMVRTVLGKGLLVLLACDLEIKVHCPDILKTLGYFPNANNSDRFNNSLLPKEFMKAPKQYDLNPPLHEVPNLPPNGLVEDIRTCLAGKDVRQKCHKAVGDYSNNHILPTPAEQMASMVTFATELQNMFKGPMMVPPLELYVLAGQFLSRELKQTNGLTSAVLVYVYQLFGNLLHTGSLHLAPEGPMLDSLVAFLKKNYSPFQRTIPIVTHKSEATAVQTFLSDPKLNVWALIVLNDTMKNARTIEYTIRMLPSQVPSTNDVIDYTSVGFDPTYQQYILSGFFSLQAAVDEWSFAYKGGTSCTSRSVHPTMNTLQHPSGRTIPTPFKDGTIPPLQSAALEPFPTYAYTNNDFYSAGGLLIGLIFIVATFYPFGQMVTMLVEERETGREQLMKTMGLFFKAIYLSPPQHFDFSFHLGCILLDHTFVQHFFPSQLPLTGICLYVGFLSF